MAPKADSAFDELVERLQHGDRTAMDEAYAQHEPLIGLVARRFWWVQDHEDLRQVAAMGLVKALGRFDPGRGHKFSTYAVPVMIGEVRHWLAAQEAAGLGRAAADRRRALRQALDEWQARGEPPPTVDMLADQLSWDRATVVETLALLPSLVSWDQIAGQGVDLAAVEDETQWVRDLDLAKAWAKLTPADRALLLARFHAGKSQAAVARELHLSQAEISRWQARIVARLAKAVESE